MNNSGKIKGGILTNLIISQLLSALEYQNWFKTSAQTIVCLINCQSLKWSYCNINEY